YRYLYGTVSISQNYTPASRSLMLSYLRQHAMEPGLSRYIHAYEPPRALEIGLRSQDRRLLVRALPELKFLNTQVSALEPDGKGIPVLLRQYLRLGGRMVAFNVDSDFGDTLDCFVVVDLENAPKRLLDRYCGKNA
ncbi:MAG: glycerol acyltransferase, partial [Akkermansia sp.]